MNDLLTIIARLIAITEQVAGLTAEQQAELESLKSDVETRRAGLEGEWASLSPNAGE